MIDFIRSFLMHNKKTGASHCKKCRRVSKKHYQTTAKHYERRSNTK